MHVVGVHIVGVHMVGLPMMGVHMEGVHVLRWPVVERPCRRKVKVDAVKEEVVDMMRGGWRRKGQRPRGWWEAERAAS